MTAASQAASLDEELCAICLEPLLLMPRVVLLCAHTFHDRCLRKKKNIICPTCKQDRYDMERRAHHIGPLDIRCARVLVTDVRDDDHYVLLVQERDGAWNLPGGHIDESIDTEPEACARRKLLEKTTLVLSDDLIPLASIGEHMIYIAKERAFSFRFLPLRRRTREIRALWWGPMQSALDWSHCNSSLLSSEAQEALIIFMSRSS